MEDGQKVRDQYWPRNTFGAWLLFRMVDHSCWHGAMYTVLSCYLAAAAEVCYSAFCQTYFWLIFHTSAVVPVKRLATTCPALLFLLLSHLTSPGLMRPTCGRADIYPSRALDYRVVDLSANVPHILGNQDKRSSRPNTAPAAEKHGIWESIPHIIHISWPCHWLPPSTIPRPRSLCAWCLWGDRWKSQLHRSLLAMTWRN